jgi:hypothetical protein
MSLIPKVANLSFRIPAKNNGVERAKDKSVFLTIKKAIKTLLSTEIVHSIYL